jgi:hypothetical protein
MKHELVRLIHARISKSSARDRVLVKKVARRRN